MAGNRYGLDFGTYEIKVYDKKRDFIWKEKSAVAVKDKKEVIAVGDEAYVMYEKTPADIEVRFPMQNGVIARLEDMQFLLEYLLEKRGQFSGGAEYLLAVPTDVTQVEKRAFYNLVYHSSARAKSVFIVERGIADAVGLGLDIFGTNGVMLVDLGGGTVEISVLASGGIVLNRLLKIGGERLDQAIIEQIRHQYDFVVGRRTAERLRKDQGILGTQEDDLLQAAGQNRRVGLPQRLEVPVGLVREAMKAPLEECVSAIRSMVGRTPPDIRRAMDKNGIYLTGGLADLGGLCAYLEEKTGLKVTAAEDPELCSVRGLRQIIQNTKEYGRAVYSMLDEKYRWLR